MSLPQPDKNTSIAACVQPNSGGAWVLNTHELSFINHFGEMGSRWGLNRTIGQMYALLFLVPRFLNADEIAEHLHFSRSNVSMGLKELQSWRLIRSTYKMGDRREYYSALEDTWEIFKTLAQERQRRELNPTLDFLRNALVAQDGKQSSPHTRVRMQQMYDVLQLGTKWFTNLSRLERSRLERLMRLGSKALGLLGRAGKD